MREECLEILRTYMTKAVIRHATDSSYNIFDGLVALMQTNWDASPTTMRELRIAKKTKDKGDLFEHFAYLYFKHVYQINKQKPTEVYLLKDAPDEVLEELGLKRHDLGIDIILKFERSDNADSSTSVTSKTGNVYCAVQIKYRQPNHYKPHSGVSWADLSTFYALVNRSGPYRKHIILTNSNYVRHIGRKEFKDQSICIGTLRKISIWDWRVMAGITDNHLTSVLAVPLNSGPTPLSTLSNISTMSIGTVSNDTIISDKNIIKRPRFSRLPIITPNSSGLQLIPKINSGIVSAIVDVNVVTTQKTQVPKRGQSVVIVRNQPQAISNVEIRPSNIEELRRRRCEFYDKVEKPPENR